MQRNLLILMSAIVLLFSGESYSQRRSADLLLPQGTDIQVRLAERLDSDTNRSGQTFEAILDQDLHAGGSLFARAGNTVKGRLVEVVDSGRVRGRARMSLTLTEIQAADGTYPIETNNVVVEASGSAKRDATVIGGTAVLGAIIGAIAGGKKGAGLGAIIGAAGGTGAVLVTEGKDVEFEAEQKFNFILARDLRTGSTVSTQSSTRSLPYGRGVETRVENHNEVELIAQELKNKADHVYSSFRSRQGRIKRTGLSMELSSFANNAGIFAESLTDARETSLVSEARRLISQAEKIDRLMERATGTGVAHLREDWSDVQDEVERLSAALNLTYATRANLAASDPSPYSDTATFRWRGQVDGVDHIILQGSRVSIRHLQAERILDPNYELTSSLPRYPVTVYLTRMQGRGRVEIVEQPTARNNYAAVILIEDRERGSDYYEFELTWQPR